MLAIFLTAVSTHSTRAQEAPRDIDLFPRLASAIGAQFTTYGVPDRLKPIYGAHPVGVAVFLRLRPFSAHAR